MYEVVRFERVFCPISYEDLPFIANGACTKRALPVPILLYPAKMQFLRGLRVNSPVLGLCWLLLIYLISSLPVEALPSQIHDVLPSEPYGFVAEKGLHRRAPPELESWDIYQKYKKRKEKSPEEKLPPGLSSSLPVAKRQTLDDNVSQLYTFNDRTVTVTKTILGQGGDGVVYKGTLDTKPVAVKMSSSKELAQAGVYMVDLKESPNVMEQLAIFRSESFEPGPDRKRQPMLFQVMPMMDGSLASWLETVNDDDFQRYHKSLARQSLQGLVNIHKKGIAHRDYKPDNIFVQNKDGEMLAYVGDLDRASDIVDTAMTGAGTQGYTSLGKHRGGPTSHPPCTNPSTPRIHARTVL